MMKQRIARVSLIGMLIFGLLLGGQILYKNNWTNGQLVKDSRQISGVLSAQVVTENGQQILEVKVDHVQNLKKVGEQLENIAGQRPIRFNDQRTPELEKVLAQMEFPLQESVARGNFTEMQRKLQELADQAGVTLELSMDNEGIYLNLTKGQAQLVEVIERHAQGKFLES
ncbi:hypothetical protein ACHOLT_15215 [Desulfitobacterium sp. Sab5]|uniref:hypothetical protein n=1 Tax=Desulfitobacterium nosdiversum TaxID=3375356 RepID=UPI003CF621B1